MTDQLPRERARRPSPEPASSSTLGRRSLLIGAVAATAGIGALAVNDVVPWPRGDVDLTWLPERLREAGLVVREEDGWRDRGRPFGGFRPTGVLMHHTGFRATGADPRPARATVLEGREGLAGPLCHVLVDREGVCHVIAAGRANHAGEVVEDGPMPGGDGNVHYVGIEIDYAPQDPYGQSPTAEQRATSVAAAAAIVTGLGTDADHVRYHKDVSTSGKWDPGNFLGADAFRAEVAAAISTRWA